MAYKKSLARDISPEGIRTKILRDGTPSKLSLKCHKDLKAKREMYNIAIDDFVENIKNIIL